MRKWLIRATIFIVGLFRLSFLFIFFRGLAWSPNEINHSETYVELGATELVQQQRERLWLTRLSPMQRKELQQINPYVFTEGGCDFQVERCLVQSKTNRQGVIVRYIETKPDILKQEIPWVGGFINPTNGAIYDLLGRLYRGSTRVENVPQFIDYPLKQG